MKRFNGKRSVVVGLASAFLVIVGVASFPSKVQAATYPGVNGRILYTFVTSSPRPLFSVRVDGTDEKTVLTSSADKTVAKYSPNGLKIAYVQSVSAVKQIFVANADGTNPQQITTSTENADTPSWSPDGTKILFSQTVSSTVRIVRMNADGSGQTQLTTTAAYLSPEYSADGTKIAAMLDATDNEIVVMNADGSNIVNVTNNSVDEGYANWSPTGSKIVYSSEVSGSQEIFTLNADGSSQTQLTSDGKDYHVPVYSPDGTKIAFIDTLAPSLLYIMNTDGSNMVEVPTSWPMGLSWQPLTVRPSSSNPNPTVALSDGKATVDIPSMYTDAYEGIDKATVTVVSAPASGTTSVNSTTGVITYTPKTTALRSSFWSNIGSLFFPKVSAAPTDSFTYRVCSSASSSLCSTGTITVSLLGAPATGAGQPSGMNVAAWAFAALSASALTLGIRRLRSTD